MSTYLYGIVHAPSRADRAADDSGSKPRKLKLPDTGVGHPPAPVRLLKDRALAAVVSDVPDDYHAEVDGLRGMRRDMRAHANVLNAIIASATVLPFSFGVVLPDDDTVIAGVLRPQSARFTKYLDALDGSVELTLRATSIEQQALRAVVAAHPELAPPPRGGGGGIRGGGRRGGASLAYESRIELGRQLAAAVQDLQQRDARLIIDTLAPVVRDVRVGKPLRDLMALNASFLVDRAKLKKFDRALEKLHDVFGHRLEFDCVGPLPPYSFVDLRL